MPCPGFYLGNVSFSLLDSLPFLVFAFECPPTDILKAAQTAYLQGEKAAFHYIPRVVS
jgi:hypothetical protein